MFGGLLALAFIGGGFFVVLLNRPQQTNLRTSHHPTIGAGATVVVITLHKPGEFNLQVPFPTDWDELTTAELLAVCKVQLKPWHSAEEARAGMFGELLTMRAKKLTNVPDNFTTLLNPNDFAEIGYNLAEFLYTVNNRTIQPFPSLELPGKTVLTGPADAFNNLTCGEMEDTEIYFTLFTTQPAHEHLAHLAAILYRPAGTRYISIQNNEAVRYNHQPMVQQFLIMPMEFLYAIYCWYTGCRNLLPQLFPTVYDGASADQSDEPSLTAFTKCIHSGAGPKNGTRTQIRMMPVKEFYFDMEQEAIQAKKLESK